jgi:hypothetical protein
MPACARTVRVEAGVATATSAAVKNVLRSIIATTLG